MFKQTIVAAALAAAAVSANALSAGLGSLSSSFIDLASAGVVTGGALYTANALPNAAIPHNASPVINTVGTWLAAGPDNTNNGGGDAVLHLGAGTTGVSFLWGSPDDYNSFVVTTNLGLYDVPSTLLTPLGIVLNGNQSSAYYLNFIGDVGETISSVAFQSPGTNAIEIANVAVVPEPEAYGLALAGLSVIGFAMARRRKS